MARHCSRTADCRVAVGTQQLLLHERRGGKALRAWTTPAGGVGRGVPGLGAHARGVAAASVHRRRDDGRTSPIAKCYLY